MRTTLARGLMLVVATASLAACNTTGGLAVRRASGEFSCPEERINVLDRSDITDGLFDVEACGKRARYACINGQYAHQCVREPDPPRWVPDPAICGGQDAAKPKPERCYVDPFAERRSAEQPR